MDRATWLRDVVARFEAPLVRYAMGIVGDRARARDVVQDTFLKLCQADRARIEGYVQPWLYRVCRNRALDVRRRESRVQLEVVPERPQRPAVEQKSDAAIALDIVDTLPDAQREAILLRFRDGLSYRDIAEVTGKTTGTVGYLLHEGLKRVRAAMEETR